MGTKFDAPNINNPKGYWEDLEFKELHDRILSGEEIELNEYLSLVQERSALDLWGIKDPKICNTLPLLTECLDAIEVHHKVIECNRPIQDIARSIQKGINSYQPLDWWIALAEMYILKKAESLQSYPGEILSLEFEEIHSPDYVQKIADYAGVEVTQSAMAFMGFDQSPASS
jgi:hypothetical protein